MKIRQKLREFYLDWVNNFLTVAFMADYYGISYELCYRLIDIGKALHEAMVKQYKLSLAN